jgi:predicted ester cyclase
LILCSVAALGAGCKKKAKEKVAPPEPSPAGSNTGSGGSNAMSGSGGSAAGTPEAKLEGKGMADKYVTCVGLINDNKMDDFKSKCLAKDYKGHEMDGMEIENPDKVVEWFAMQHTAFPDMKMQPQLIIVNGRNIMAVGLVTGTQSGPLKGPMGEIPATNKKVGFLMFHRLTINDENRATEEWAYSDPTTMIGQLGLLPKEAGETRPALDKGWDGAPIIAVTADNDVEKKNIDIVKKAGADFAAKKIADSVANYTDDALESDQAEGKDHKGKKEIQAGSEMFWKAFPDMKLDSPDVFAAGDFVVVQGTFEGTNKGPLGPMKATNKVVKGHYAEVFKLKDGKMSEVWRFRNGMAMAMQMGLMKEPPPPGGGGGSAAGSAAGSGGGDMKKDEKKDDKKKDDKKKDDAKKSG